MSRLDQYDAWLTADDVAAIVIREQLVPVEGPDGIFFPATYAATKDRTFPGGYNIDPPAGEKNVCLVDSVGSQANRMEPLFTRSGYAELVPQIFIEAGENRVNLLEAGHRAGDAVVRCTPLQRTLQNAFRDVLSGTAVPMAKVAPTSLVFGVWDSRDTQVKLPRLIAATIRAFDVQRLTRSAVYSPPLDYVEMDVFTDAEQKKAEGDEKNPLSKRGFVNALASATHGGVIARGGVRRDVTFSLAALRLLAAADDSVQTLALRRYVLGLVLVVLTAPSETYLRQGCNLVPDGDHPHSITLVRADGTRESLTIDHDACLAFAKLAAQGFGVGESLAVKFDPELAKKDLTGDGDAKQSRKNKSKAGGESV